MYRSWQPKPGSAMPPQQCQTVAMVAVNSFMVPLGTPAPKFTLPSLDGQTISPVDQAAGRPLLVMFLSNHCPYVRHIERVLGSMLAEYADQDLLAVAISSN